MSENDKWNGTSFHGYVIVECSVNDVCKVFGEPHVKGCCDDKVQNDWKVITPSGVYFTIYDWRLYREISNEEKVEFHIGHKKGDEHEINTYLQSLSFTVIER